jgi:F-type H+-transporting ATPase subunit b
MSQRDTKDNENNPPEPPFRKGGKGGFERYFQVKFDIWTFLFQIINFVVLLFILKRLLYKPIREIMEKRRGLIEKTVEDAERAKKEALELKEKHQEELKNLSELRIQMLEKVKEEAETERKKVMSEAEKEAKKIIEKKRLYLILKKGGLRQD